ncbi:MAG: hypothetical protein ACI93N_002107 [Flavobacteriaceae bacterium]|jgi:hypothetical protein
MELYIEKEFLDDFYAVYDFFADYSDEEIKVRLKNVFTEYGAKQVFIDYNSEDFHQFLKDNTFFEMMASNDISPISVESIEEDLFKNSNFNQTLVFTQKENIWFNKAESMGALCFTFDNYEEKIKSIINQLHFKIDLSETFNGWDFLDAFSTINYNKVIITDGYVLGDKSNQKMSDNIIPILKKIIISPLNNVSVKFFTKELKPLSSDAKHIKEQAKKRCVKFNSLFANFKVNFKIINSDLNAGFDLHDRNIATNFSLLDSGKGLNLIPHKTSNSQIISKTIFEKYTYNRLNNIISNQNQYVVNIKKLDPSKFKMYPEINS